MGVPHIAHAEPALGEFKYVQTGQGHGLSADCTVAGPWLDASALDLLFELKKFFIESCRLDGDAMSESDVDLATGRLRLRTPSGLARPTSAAGSDPPHIAHRIATAGLSKVHAGHRCSVLASEETRGALIGGTSDRFTFG